MSLCDDTSWKEEFFGKEFFLKDLTGRTVQKERLNITLAKSGSRGPPVLAWRDMVGMFHYANVKHSEVAVEN